MKGLKQHCSEFRGTGMLGSKPVYGISLMGFLKSQYRGSWGELLMYFLKVVFSHANIPLLMRLLEKKLVSDEGPGSSWDPQWSRLSVFGV